jgi:ubiquinone biosynthesis protein
MPDSSLVDEQARPVSPAELLVKLLSENVGTSERIRMIEAELEGPAGQLFREQMSRWVIQFLPLDHLVPNRYAEWRPLVRDAMLFFATHLSTARLAPKLAEQVELPLNTSPEVRLLRLIAKVPGLQKLGQVLARNRTLPASLRRALSELENGICDVDVAEIRAIIHQELGRRLEDCAVEIEPAIFFEASVSAVVRFTWYNPDLQQRERGVFKVMKPYIPACFAEDMDLLARLAKYLGSKHRQYGFAEHVLPDTFQDVRRLLKHEVQFSREQKTLLEAHRFYNSVPGVRVPRLIAPLCTAKITAITEEHGKKVTDAAARLPAWRRHQVCEQLIEKLIAIPLFAPKGDVMFHADPHAGNLLYDKDTRELVILDWALTEKLSRDQRRHLAMLFVMVFLRDPVGACYEIQALRRGRGRHGKREARIISDRVTRFITHLPITQLPRAVDTMGLLESIAWAGVRLPAPLVMLRKVLFTLDGILHDIAGPGFRMEYVMARYIVKSWMTKWSSSPLSLTDWLLVQCSTLLFPSRVGMQWAQMVGDQPSSDKSGSGLAGTKASRRDSPRRAKREKRIRQRRIPIPPTAPSPAVPQ